MPATLARITRKSVTWQQALCLSIHWCASSTWTRAWHIVGAIHILCWINPCPFNLHIVCLVPSWVRKVSSYFPSLLMNLKASGSFGAIFPFLFFWGSAWQSRWSSGLGVWDQVLVSALQAAGLGTSDTLASPLWTSLPQSCHLEFGLLIYEWPSSADVGQRCSLNVLFKDKPHFPAPSFSCLLFLPGSLLILHIDTNLDPKDVSNNSSYQPTLPV